MKKFIFLVCACFFSFVFLTYKNTQVPPGINGDEVGIARNAILISRNLMDENDNFLPLFVFAKGSDWKQPITVYTTALVFKVFGISLMSLRASSVLFVIASILILFFIAKEAYDFKFFMAGFLVLITIPIIMIQSHLALENIAVLPFVFIWILMLFRYQNKKKLLNILFAGAFLGAGMFSYLGMRIIVPVLSLITLMYLRKNVKSCVYFVLGIAPFIILLFISNFYYPGAVVGHFSAPPPSIYDFILRYLAIFDLSFLFLKGDTTVYHSTGKAGMFLLATLPVFIIGIFRIIKNRKPFEILMLTSFFLAPIMFGFVPDVYRASRLLALIPFFVIISTIGLSRLSMKWIILIVLLISINCWNITKDYWYEYPKRVEKDFPLTISDYDNEFNRK